MPRRNLIAGLALVATPLALTTGAVGAESATTKVAKSKASKRFTKLDLLAINDFHGQLEKGSVDTREGRTGSGEVNVHGTDVSAGGAEYLGAGFTAGTAAAATSRRAA